MNEDSIFRLLREYDREAIAMRAKLRKSHIGEGLWMCLAALLALALCIVLANERAGEIAAWLHGVAGWMR